MSEIEEKRHHPLPKDERARHDRIPESIEDERDQGDDSPCDQPASKEEPPEGRYANPDGTTYEA